MGSGEPITEVWGGGEAPSGVRGRASGQGGRNPALEIESLFASSNKSEEIYPIHCVCDTVKQVRNMQLWCLLRKNAAATAG